jgi:hypothetical protein
VLLTLGEWGNRWLAPKGEPMVHVDAHSHARLRPLVVDRRSLKAMSAGKVALAAGRGAPAALKRLLATPRVLGGKAVHQ